MPSRKHGPSFRKASDRFGRGEVMASAQHQVQQQRRVEKQLSSTVYHGPPPNEDGLFQARLIIPGEHLVPKGFTDLSILDEIRHKHKVWITRDQEMETCLDISSMNVKGLQNAIQAINWKIHDMRLSEESVTTQFFPQALSESNSQIPIAFEIDKRPIMKDGISSPLCQIHVIDALSSFLVKLLPSSFKALIAIPGLKMRATFGHLSIKAKRKNTENLLLFKEYSDVLRQYSARGGGAVMQTEMPHIGNADKFLSSILKRPNIVQLGMKPSIHHRLEFAVGTKTVSADIPDGEGTIRAISPRWAQVDRSPPLDWSISAPDKAVDWNLRVDSLGVHRQMPEATARLVEMFAFSLNTDKVSSERKQKQLQCFNLPRVQVLAQNPSAQPIQNIQVKTSARLQYRDTAYEMEITITQQWEQAPIQHRPNRTSWSVSVYGINWDEVLNYRTSREESTSYEEQLSRVWPGQGSLKQRLQEFVECILLLQAALTEIFPS